MKNKGKIIKICNFSILLFLLVGIGMILLGNIQGIISPIISIIMLFTAKKYFINKNEGIN